MLSCISSDNENEISITKYLSFRKRELIRTLRVGTLLNETSLTKRPCELADDVCSYAILLPSMAFYCFVIMTAKRGEWNVWALVARVSGCSNVASFQNVVTLTLECSSQTYTVRADASKRLWTGKYTKTTPRTHVCNYTCFLITYDFLLYGRQRSYLLLFK